MTQTQLADAVDLSQGQISQILNGDRGTKLTTLDRFAEALGVDVAALFTENPSAQLPAHAASGDTVATPASEANVETLGLTQKAELRAARHLLETLNYAINEALIRLGDDALGHRDEPLHERVRQRAADSLRALPRRREDVPGADPEGSAE